VGGGWSHSGFNLADPRGKGTPEKIARIIAYAAKMNQLYRRGWDGIYSDNWVFGSIGASWYYGSNLDTDRDGVPDASDQCPSAAEDTATKKITYHDPCFLGRHNQVYTPPRELLAVIPNTTFEEMPRNNERSFCCGAGGGRMWMEEKIGERINVNRTKEAVATGADQIAVGCPFCRVMLSDGLTAEQHAGQAREEVEVLDVAQLLLSSVKRGEPPA
jgi:hypothetical protein